jgi:hypothetical protein
VWVAGGLAVSVAALPVTVGVWTAEVVDVALGWSVAVGVRVDVGGARDGVAVDVETGARDPVALGVAVGVADPEGRTLAVGVAEDTNKSRSRRGKSAAETIPSAFASADVAHGLPL